MKLYSAEQRIPLIIAMIILIFAGATVLHFGAERPFLKLRDWHRANRNQRLEGKVQTSKIGAAL